ncbi:MAG: InlB B-repeat-containing protein [Oscillospiraceae bacterium]|nr:InlB B-repeat-containing protein [Oscillospiraceae bacterium]
MKKKLTKALLACMLVLTMVLACGCTNEPGPTDPSIWKVTFYDTDGTTVLQEVEVTDGEAVTVPELTKEGYIIEGYYATPALMVEFDVTKPITEDTAVFVAWQSSVVDERPWMLAGSLAGYPDNNWGKKWPQDDYLLQPVEGEFNTFAIEVNLYAGDAFKIAVIGEGYAWDNNNSIDAGHLANKTETALMSSGENAFDSGANIEVQEDGKYRLILKTDAETLSLCSLSYERLGDADPKPTVDISYDMKLWASFNNWAGQDMLRNGDDLIWYCEADVPADGGEFGVKNAATGDWYSSENNSKNIVLEEGHYMFFIELELVDGKPVLKGEIVAAEPAYYVVGTCGNAGWAADVNAENTAYKMTEQDGKYVLEVTFTEDEIADWADNKVAFKVAYGCGGRVANEYWWGAEGGANITVDPGTYTITFDPAAGTVTVA